MEAKRLEKHKRWLYSQAPLISGWLWLKEAETLARGGLSPSGVSAGGSCDVQNHERVRAIALEALRQLADQSCIDTVCEVWVTTRHTELTRSLIERGWVATAPAEVWVLSALEVGWLEVVTAGSAEVLDQTRAPGADFRNATLAKAEVYEGVTFSECDLRGAIFDGANLDGMRCEKCLVDGASGAHV